MQNNPHVLVFGAGKSATELIDYLGRWTATGAARATIVDQSLAAAQSKTAAWPQLTALALDIQSLTERRQLVSGADLVISLLPPQLHVQVAQDCLALGKHLLTASYLDPAIRAMAPDIAAAGLLFLGEMGLDPGIDHMSALQLVHRIQAQGGTITSFLSHCGGLVAPESDTHPWHYKISWNPRNVVTAGQAGAQYRWQGKTVQQPYESIFENNPRLSVAGLPELAYYPNRDSLSYIPLYGLESAQNFLRTTLRYPGFCSGWSALVKAGLTRDDLEINTDGLSVGAFFQKAFEAAGLTLDNATAKAQMEYLGWNNAHPINRGPQKASAVLQTILEDRWQLMPGDKDLVVMVHEIEYVLAGKKHQVNSQLVVKGQDALHTAMAKTVGLPLGIAARLFLTGQLPVKGLHIPVLPEIYGPVLAALQQEGIVFVETEKEI